MALVQRRSDFSTLLRLALLLVLCFVFLKCEAAPGTAEMYGTKTHELRFIEKRFEQDLKTGQGSGKSRHKRDDQIVLPRNVPGIEDSRLKPDTTSIPFKDGKICYNGQEPFDEKEAKLYWKYIISKTLLYSTARGSFLEAETIQASLKAQQYDTNCESKKCSFDPKTASLICGNPNEGVFDDGKRCDDGSDPPSDEPSDSFRIQNQDAVNKEVTQKVGKWCKTKICTLQLRGLEQHPVCGTYTPPPPKKDRKNASISIQPILTLFLTLVGISVFAS